MEFFLNFNSTFLLYEPIKLSSRAKWPIPTLSPLSLCFHTPDCHFLSLIPSLFVYFCLPSQGNFIILALTLPISLISLYCKYTQFPPIVKQSILYVSYVIFPNSLVHCIFTHHKDVFGNFFLSFCLPISISFQFLI